MNKYTPTIGMEVHVELATDSKMFCACKNELGLDRVPNTNICPICTGQPGALPAANEKANEFVIKAGLALGCEIAQLSNFNRSGAPLMELVTEPDITSAEEAKKFCEHLEVILRSSAIPDAAMDKWQ